MVLPLVEAPSAAEEPGDHGNDVVIEAPPVRTMPTSIESMESRKVSAPEPGSIEMGLTLSRIPSTPEWMERSIDRLPIGE